MSALLVANTAVFLMWRVLDKQFMTNNFKRYGKVETLLFMLSFTIFIGLGASTPVLSINSPDGDIIDCVNREHQPTGTLLIGYRNISDVIMEARMGSGEFSDKGFRQAAYFCNLHVATNNTTLLPVKDFDFQETNPDYYKIKRRDNRACEHHFYFCGPGPQRSGVAQGTRQ